jgi:Protein of unknown function (DUF1570)
MLSTLLLSLILAQPAEWPFDELHTKNGQRYRGLLLEELPNIVRFRIVNRPVGRPTVTFTTVFARSEIATVRSLALNDRETLKAKLAELDPTGNGERVRMESLTLHAADWLGTPNAAKRYESEQFILTSSASDEITRRAAVRLEHIFAAYARFLPPRTTTPTRPTTILLAPDQDEYAKLLGPNAGLILNPAVFDLTNNRIICGTDLRRLGQNLSAARVHNVQQLAALNRYETDLRQLYKNASIERDRFLVTVNDQRRKIWAAERANTTEFDAATAKLFSLLYHEAFHAYIASAVYRPATGELPRWLNEGLAQIFETAILDGNELRVGHADRERLAKAQEFAKRGQLVPMSDLLRTGQEAFIANHAEQKAATDRVYVTTWAAAFYLMFERRQIGTPKFDVYVQTLAKGGDRLVAFREWLEVDPTSFDGELRSYIERLRTDGTTR